jgi:hypothetical protein
LRRTVSKGVPGQRAATESPHRSPILLSDPFLWHRDLAAESTPHSASIPTAGRAPDAAA